MSYICFDFGREYFVKLSNHGYVEIYDKKCLDALRSDNSKWTSENTDKCLIESMDCDYGVVDNATIDDCRMYARRYLGEYLRQKSVKLLKSALLFIKPKNIRTMEYRDEASELRYLAEIADQKQRLINEIKQYLKSNKLEEKDV